MTTSTTTKTPIWFIIISILALLWNAMGVMAYLSQAYMSNDAIAKLTETEQQMYANLPSWYIAAFAIAVFAGTFGSLGLVLKKKWAYVVLLISLIAAVVQMSYLAFVLKMANPMTPLIVIVGIGLVWLAKYATKKHWLS